MPELVAARAVAATRNRNALSSARVRRIVPLSGTPRDHRCVGSEAAGAQLEPHLLLLDPTRRARFGHAIAALERRPKDVRVSVLDAVCCDGLFAQAVAQRWPEWELVGVDVTDELLDRARTRAAAFGIQNVTFRHEVGDAEFDELRQAAAWPA